MKAWRFYAIGDMRLDEIPYPQPQDGWVTIKTRVVQPSVTEAVRARGGPTAGVEFIKKTIAEHAPVQLFGHEFTGEVVELGEGVTTVRLGDRVSARSSVPCHRCELCRRGQVDRCRRGPSIGQQIPGGFCEYFALPAEALALLPTEVSDSEGACIQPLSSCVAIVADTGIQVGDTVAIMGQGVMGLSILQLANMAGAGHVIGVDVRETNLRLSKQLGSDHQVNAGAVDPIEAIAELTHGLGADVVFECAGGSPAEGLAGVETLKQATRLVADAGKIVQVAHLGQPVQIDPDYLRKKSIKYIFAAQATSKFMDHAVRVVATGQVKLKPLITHVLHGLEKAPEAFEITSNKAKYDAVNPAQVVVSK